MFAALLLFALAQRQRAAAPAQPVITDWTIEITTEGGFTGGGVGGMTVSSDGTLTIVMGAAKKCTYRLSPGEVQSVTAAVSVTRPGTWMECYSLADVRTHCCDLVTTRLKLSERGGRDVFITSWLTGAPPFPIDLQNLVDLLRGPAGIDARYRPLCASTP